MPKIVTPLTASQVKNAKPRDKIYSLSDGGGLALWVLVSGSKSWRIQYVRPEDKKMDTLVLGNFPDFSLADARAWRDEVRAMLARGINPKQAKELDKDYCFYDCFVEWHTRWKVQRQAKYATQVFNAVVANLDNSLLYADVRTVKAKQIVDSLRGMESRGVLEYLRRVRYSLNMFFDYLVSCGKVEFNPCRIIASSVFDTPAERHFDALQVHEFSLFIETIEKSNIKINTKLAIYWQFLTMTRPNETINARFCELDLQAGLWVIPMGRMKKRREHVVPLIPPLLDLLAEIKAVNVRGVYLFEGLGFDKPISVDTPRSALRKMGLKTTAHGLRALARSYLREKYHIREDVGEALLSHSRGDKTNRAYDRTLLLQERAEMLNHLAKDFVRVREHCKRDCE